MKQHHDDFYLGEWLAEYKKYLIGGGIAFALLLLLLWSQLGSGATQNDYIIASNQYTVFKKAISSPNTANEALSELSKLSALMDKYPVLHQKYDGDIAQLLLAAGQKEQALPFANNFLKLDFDPSVNLYKEFAEQTIALSEGNTQKAIEKGNAITQASSPTSGLYAFSSFQTALLEKSLGDVEIARQAWSRLKNSLHEPAFQAISPLFTMGNVTLMQFISSQN
ncbi:MAG: hypothetical protein WC222_04400 [Parachlamydiales bacterium]|jgi:tetratricopeptide (TPR) repeat protein